VTLDSCRHLCTPEWRQQYTVFQGGKQLGHTLCDCVKGFQNKLVLWNGSWKMKIILTFLHYHHHHHMALQPKSGPGLPFFGFHNNNLYTGLYCYSSAQPPTWRTRSPYLWPPETGWPRYTPRHWVPILVAFYDSHGLQRDYSLIPATTRENFLHYPSKI
jgi:hypothetical protein